MMLRMEMDHDDENGKESPEGNRNYHFGHCCNYCGRKVIFLWKLTLIILVIVVIVFVILVIVVIVFIILVIWQ